MVNINPDLKLASGQLISGTDPNYAEYAKDASVTSKIESPIATPAVSPISPASPVSTPVSQPMASKSPNYNEPATGPIIQPAQALQVKPTVEEPIKNESLTKITSSLNKGLYNEADIATDTGLTPEEVKSSLIDNYNLNYLKGLNKNYSKIDSSYQDYKKKMEDIKAGAFTLTESEQAELTNAQRILDKAREDQLMANKNYEGTTEKAGIRSGRQEFMTEIATGEYKQAVDKGLRTIQDMDAKALSYISNLKEAFKNKQYKEAGDLYNQMNKSLAEKSKAITEVHNATVKLYDDIDKRNKAAEEAKTKELNRTKLQQTINKTTIDQLAPSIAESLTGNSTEDADIIKQLADYYDLDANLVSGAVEKYQSSTPEEKAKIARETADLKAQQTQTAAQEKSKVSFEQDMLKKGYKTINPADIAKVKARGEDVVQYEGRVYSKPGKETQKVVAGTGKNAPKFLITYDQYGREIKREKMAGGVVTSGTKKTTKATNYTANNIPGDVKNDLMEDLSGDYTPNEVIKAYPEVSSSYIYSLYGAKKKYK